MYIDMLMKYFSYNIKFQNSQIFAFALISFALISLFTVAFFRTYLYGDLYSTGHRYGIINLLIYLGILIFYFDNFRKKIKPLNKIKLFLLLYLASLIWIYVNFVTGEFLIDRKHKFTKISSQILNDEEVDINTYREINFYPNLEESKILYQKLWESNLFNLKKND